MHRNPFYSLKRRRTSSGGLTLIEVMVGFALLAITMMGILALMLQSYRLTVRTRCLDEARNVLRSMADQVMSPSAPDALLEATTAPTGSGLNWNGTDGTSAGLSVTLGQASNLPVTATVVREVKNLSENGTTATVISSPAEGLAGRLVQCRLTLTFTQGNRPWTSSLVLVRSTAK